MALMAMVALGGTGSATAQAAPYEPNDVITQPYGPILGDTPYVAGTETSNDVDYYLFYTAGQTQLDVAVTNTTSPYSLNCGADFVVAKLLDEDGRDINEIDPRPQITEHILYTAPGAKRFYVLVSSFCAGVTYQATVSPAAGLTTTPPPPKAQVVACQQAQIGVVKLSRSIVSTKRRLRHARTRSHRRRTLRKRLVTYTRRLAQNQQSLVANCTPAVQQLIANDPAYATSG